MFIPQEAINSCHYQPLRYWNPPDLFYEQRYDCLQLWAPKRFLGCTCRLWVRAIEGTRSPTLAALGERERVGTSPSASPNWIRNFQASNCCFACWAFHSSRAKLPARSQDLQPHESCRARQAVSIFSWIKPKTILFSSEMFPGPTTCASLHETTKKAPSPSYLI